jgi:protein pelota
LSQIIFPGTIINGKTYRKVEVNEKASERKQIFIEITVEKIEFKEFTDVLKALGKIMRSSDERVQKGEYHSFNLSINDEIAIIKKWNEIDFDYLNKSSNKDSNLMLVAADYGDAAIAYYHDYSIEYSTTLSEELGGKREITAYEKNKSEFIKTLLSAINELAKNRQAKSVLIGATMSLIDALKPKIKEYDYLKNKSSFSKINYGNKNGIKELINSGEAKKSIEKTQYYEQQIIINKLMELISKSKNSTYGYKFVKEAIIKGAVEELIISTEFIKKAKENNFYKELDNLIKSSNELNANLSIVNSSSELGEQIDNLSGIAAILRYNLKE